MDREPKPGCNESERSNTVGLDVALNLEAESTSGKKTPTAAAW
jgi:hypothetical protein